MDSTFITPFVKSVQNVFGTMLQLTVQVDEPQLKKDEDPSFDVSAIIGMSGDIDGSVVLSFPTTTAERVIALFTGEEMTTDDPDFADAIGELVNMVTGGAKGQFEGKRVNITCPSVVVGQAHRVFSRKDVVCITIPCDCDCGNFNVEVSIIENTSGQETIKTDSNVTENIS